MGSAKNWLRLCGLAAFGIALMAGWEFHNRAIVPLRQEESRILRDVAELTERIESAQKTITDVRIREINAGSGPGETERRQPGLPQELTALSVPKLLEEHFQCFGLSLPGVNLTGTQDEPEIPGYQRTSWSVSVPITDNKNVSSLLRATAGLGPEESSLKVLGFTIRPDPEDPRRRRAAIHVSVLSRKPEAGR